ncbi:hypothetical protein CTRI78_v009651 [Colletotrichum trifolii]|uniref:Uncharacterized protein n=1 Tax=Colletotrichum trifolii TaxID=5466 RepID=A0A4R8QRZ6_COLTR|nr:hypothetical protein CTRI78_v009651 [Colletotrichum trifolii]
MSDKDEIASSEAGFERDASSFPNETKRVLSSVTEHHAQAQFDHQSVGTPSRSSRLLVGWWGWELISMTLAVILFGLFWWLVGHFDGELVSEWHYGPQLRFSPFKTLPSAAAFISSVFRVLVLYPVTGAMGQLKWDHFRIPSARPVAKLQAFDSASRGTAGSLKLLFSKGAFYSLNISLGCILIIGALLLGSAAQNTITQELETKWTVHPKATLAVSMLYNYSAHHDENLTHPVGLNADPPMQAALLNAWSSQLSPSSLNKNINTIPARCPEGQCRWQNITTLAVGHQCLSAGSAQEPNGSAFSKQADIRGRIIITTAYGTLKMVDAQLRLKPRRSIPPLSAFRQWTGDPRVIVHLSAITQNEDHVEAVECLLYWRLHRINSSKYDAVNKTLAEDVAHISKPRSGKGVWGEGQHDIWFHAPCNSNLTTTSGEQSDYNRNGSSTPLKVDCDYVVTEDAHLGLVKFLTTSLKGYVYPDTSETPTVNRTDDAVTELFHWSLDRYAQNATDPLKQTLDTYVGNLAEGMGINMRAMSQDAVVGEAGKEEQLFLTHHWFILYPGIMLACSMYLLGYAMWRTRHQPAWKTSLLPFLYHGFERPVADYENSSNLAWMEEASKLEYVVLRDDADGLGLKLRAC